MVMPYLPSFTAPGCTSSSAFYTINNSNNIAKTTTIKTTITLPSPVT